MAEHLPAPSERNDRIRAAVRESIDLMDQWSLTWPIRDGEKRARVIDTIAGNVAASLDRTDLPPGFPSLDV